jgi:hypothetical protein
VHLEFRDECKMKQMISAAALVSAMFAMPPAFASAVHHDCWTLLQGVVVTGIFPGGMVGLLAARREKSGEASTSVHWAALPKGPF